jgi:type IV pilus assembly protein PilB
MSETATAAATALSAPAATERAIEGAELEIRCADGRALRGRLVGAFQPGRVLALREPGGAERRVGPAEVRLAILSSTSPAADEAPATGVPPRFELRLADHAAVQGDLSSMRRLPEGLLVRGTVGGRAAQVFVPHAAMSGLRIDVAPGVPDLGPSPAGPLSPDASLVLLRSGADVQAWLAAFRSQRLLRAPDLPRVPLAQAAADADPELARLYDSAVRLGLPVADLVTVPVADPAVGIIPAAVARRLGVLPLAADAHYLCVAVSDPADMGVSNTLEFMTSRRIVPVLASAAGIAHALSTHYDKVEDEALVRSLGLRGNGEAEGDQVAREAERLASERPVVKLVADLIGDAIRRRASDIHIRPGAQDVELLYRIDGELRPVRRFVRALLPALVSRIKVIGGMNIAERRVPQDGRATVTEDGRLVDLRISVLPTVDGESVVIRLLNSQDSLRRIEEIGFNPRDTQLFRDLIHRSHGMLLVTGPTGCGKSTTLYAALVEARKQNVNIVTVEDPVEYHIPSIEQVQVNRAVGTTFARTLRNILRHDPDVIMVGEIRDHETAEIAVESALTGHLVLSTLHTNSAATAVTRLLDLGVESFLLRSTLMAVLAQRLARRNFPRCAAPEAVDEHVREVLGVGADEVFHAGTGCTHCDGSGVRGRVAVYELLPVTAEIRRLVVPNADADAIHAAAVAQGMVPITDHAVALARAGVISLAEAFRIRVE